MTPLFVEIHIESTNSCGYKCVMCPRDKQTRQIGFMSLDDLSLILERIGHFEGHFHLHGFGEPLLDRKLAEKIGLIKKKFPKSTTQIISTLGVTHSATYFKSLVDAGLDIIIISFYGYNKESYQNIHGFNGFERAKHNLETLNSLKGNSLTLYVKIAEKTVFSPLPMLDEREGFIRWLESIHVKIGEIPFVHNYGDGRNYNPPTDRLCPVISGNRKNILNITWDLNVIPCCYDYNATIPFGNLKTQTLEEIFQSREYFNFFLAQKSNDLSHYPICQNCEKFDYF